MPHLPTSSAAPVTRVRHLPDTIGLLAFAWSALCRWHRRQAAVRRLNALDDHMLKDIGISRGEIDSLVRSGRDGERRRGVDFGRIGGGPWN